MVLNRQLLFLSVSAWVITLYMSSSTPQCLVQSLAEDLKQALPYALVRTTEVQDTWLRTANSDCEAADLLVDATFTRHYAMVIKDLATEGNLPVWSLNPQQDFIPAVHSNVLDLGDEIVQLARRWNWTTVSLITEVSQDGNALKDFIQASGTSVDPYKFSEEATYEVILSLLSKEIKVWSSYIVVCVADYRTCAQVLRAAFEANMMKAGYAYLLMHPPGILQVTGMPGLLHLLDPGTEQAQSFSQYHAFRIAFLVEKLTAAGSISTPEVWKRRLWNWLGTSMQLVTETALFPGNTTKVPVVRKPIIDLSINWDLTNPTKAATTPYLDRFLAASLAFSEMSSFLPSHHLRWNNVTYGSTEFVESYVRPRLQKNKAKLGAAHMTSIGSSVAMGAMNVMKELNISLPCIGSDNSVAALSNSTVFPYYVRTIASNGYVATVYMTLFHYYGWKKINFLYGNDSYGIDFYNEVKELAEEYGIEIANREDLRALDSYITPETLSKYTSHFQEILNTKVRPLLCVFTLPIPAYLLQGLYDAGARAGDIVYFGQLPGDNFAFLPALNASKVMEVALGSVQMSLATYIGSEGKAALASFERRFGFTPQVDSCFSYDSVYALAHTIQLLLHQGKDYEDPDIFMQVLRQTQFTGCSGIVSFDSGSNDRSFQIYVVLNLQGTVSSPHLVQAGYYTPTAMQLFKFSSPLIWPGGSRETPTNFVEILINCPFRKRNLHSFWKGNLIAGCCFSALIAILLLSNVILYYLFWRKPVPLLDQKTLISSEDGLLMLLIVLEACQYAGLGPSIQSININLYQIAQLISGGLDEVVDFEREIYWAVLDLVLGISGLWVFLTVFLLLQLDEKLRDVICLGNIGWLAWNTLPHLGEIAFVPITSLLMEVFVCDQAVGMDSGTLELTDSILRKDCYVQCWQGTHVPYTVAVCVVLLIYVPFSVFLRPLWQEFEPELHIKTTPVFHLYKATFQLILVALSKTLGNSHTFAHCISFISLVSLFLLLTIKTQGYNYGRVTHLYRMCLVGVLWLSTVALVSEYIEISAGYWVLTVTVGWGVLGVAGYVVMRLYYPCFLVKPKGVDTQKLFKFGFQFSRSAENEQFVIALNNSRRAPVSEQEVRIVLSS